jgi:hypothetical protein
MIYYIDVMPDGKVRAGLQYDAPEVGPAPAMTEQTLGILVQVPAPVSWSGPTETSELYWKDGAYLWVEQADLDAQRARKVDEMSQACAGAILAGFDCAALGAVHHYPADAQDQANLTACVVDSTLPGNDASWMTGFKCMDADGVREYRAHTAEQIQRVGREGKVAIMTALLKNEQLAKQIKVASADELKTIVWSA